MDANTQTPAPISPEHVAAIAIWAANQTPTPNIELTGFRQGWGAVGVLVEFDALTEVQAIQLLQLRRDIDCQISIGNSKNLDRVVFNRLYHNDYTPGF